MRTLLCECEIPKTELDLPGSEITKGFKMAQGLRNLNVLMHESAHEALGKLVQGGFSIGSAYFNDFFGAYLFYFHPNANM